MKQKVRPHRHSLVAAHFALKSTTDSTGDPEPGPAFYKSDNRPRGIRLASNTLPAFGDDTDLAEIGHDKFSETQPSNGSESSQSLMESTSSGVGRFEPEVDHEHVTSAYGGVREQPASSTSLMRYPPVKICFRPAHKKPTSEANNHIKPSSSNEARKQPAPQLGHSMGVPALASASASPPQAVHYWKTQYEDIQNELMKLRSHFQDLITKEKARESATHVLRRKYDDLLGQAAASRREVTAVKEESDEMRSELVGMKEERDREKTIIADPKEMLRLAQEGLQVAEWEERSRVAETRCKDAETGEDEVIAENEELEIKVAAAEASSKQALRQARSAQYRMSSLKKKQQAAGKDAKDAERAGEACLRALTTACAQITTLKEQNKLVATTKLKRDLNEALTAKDERIQDLEKLVCAHNVVLALTGKNKEIAELKKVTKILEEELEQFYRRAPQYRSYIQACFKHTCSWCVTSSLLVLPQPHGRM